jgi:hypothetical protein
MKYILILAVTLAYGPVSFAEADLNPNIFNTQPTATAGTAAEREGAGGTRTGTVVNPPPNSNSMGQIPGSINPGSNTGQQSQSGGSGTNAAVGGALMAAGAALMSNPPTVPPGAMLMAMGILAMMQSGEDSGAAGQSAATGAASVTNGTGTTTTPVDPTGTSSFTQAKIKEGQAKLAEAGYKVSEKGVTTPDGSFIPANSFNSPSSMAAAGIPQSAIDQAQGILANADTGALNGAKVSSVGVNTGGGGAGSGISEGDSSGSSDPGGGPMGNPFNIDGEKKGQLVAGKTVMFDGEPIGVRGQNIFDMVHSCYQKKREGKHFIESEVDVATRLPASVKPSKK